MPKTPQAEVTDGRRLRSERSRKAIIDAGLALMDEGNLLPTAQQISDKAGVGIRSFFRHFADMEALFAAVDDQIREGYEAKFIGGDRDGTLQERVRHAMERHADAYESLKNVILSSNAQLWRSEVVRKNYARSQRGLRKDLEDWLPELRQLQRNQREAADAIASFEMWHRLRAHQGLGKERAIEIVTELLLGLIER
ncbi:MAG: helix-turn-helix domain-containing protein [Pseudomonadota bacterium]